MSDKEQIGRLAFREEGIWWVAYHAEQHTMDSAIELGRIGMGLVAGSKNARTRKRDFILLMQAAFSDLVENITGIRPIWPEPPQTAPEHERKS